MPAERDRSQREPPGERADERARGAGRDAVEREGEGRRVVASAVERAEQREVPPQDAGCSQQSVQMQMQMQALLRQKRLPRAHTRSSPCVDQHVACVPVSRVTPV